MKIYSKLIFSFFLILVSIGLAFAQVSIPSQNFNLGTNVKGVWDQNSQTLTIQGNGKIDWNAWKTVKETLKLTQDNAKDIKIFFEKDIKFPDRADNFFYQVKVENITFDPDIDTRNIKSTMSMFADAVNFNGDISRWDTSYVSNMQGMFAWATKFNGDISRWDTSRVVDMGGMFADAVNFNGNISGWNTSNVSNMASMFSWAIEFNSDISKWDTSNVKSMQGMFSWVTKFNSDISNWNFQKLRTSVRGITINSDWTNTRDFEYPSIHYENLLKNLEKLFRPLTSLNRKTIDIQSTYCETYQLRDNLIQKGLKITHDKFDCHPKLRIVAPTTLSGSAITNTIITFESDFSLTEWDLSKISVDKDNTTVEYFKDSVGKDLKCSLSTDAKKIQCNIKITSTKQGKKLTIKFLKDLWNNRTIAATASTEYITIDKVKPSISKPSSNSINHGKTWKISFKTNDEWGAGLWKKADENSDPNYNSWAITYGISLNKTCDNYTSLGNLKPQTTEPFEYTFDFSDSNHNNEYLCIQVKDKVGNTQISSIADPININIPPQLPSQSTTIKETSTIGTTVLTLQGTDQNPGEKNSLKYKIIDWNIDDAFSLSGNEIKVNKPLSYEKLAQYNLKIQVEDERGLTGEAIMTISIQDDLAPQFEAFPAQTIKLKKRRTLSPSIAFLAKDNGKLISVDITNLPLGLTATKKKLNDKEIEIIISGAPTLNWIYTTTVIATDNEGLTTEKAIKFDVRNINNNQTTPSYDNCPNGDHSGSRTDGRCNSLQIQINTGKNEIIPNPSVNLTWSQVLLLTGEVKQSLDLKPELVEGKTKYQDTVIFNPTIENGKCYTRREYLGIKDSEKIATSEEFKKALSFLRSYEMTMFDNIDGFDPYRNLSREEAAKIFSNFAMHVLCRKPDMNLSVKYSDVENADPSLKPYITLAYQLGVMKGSGMGDGEFRPFDAISKAEVNAVLIRMILKSYLDEKETELKTRYSEYNKVATDLGIINQGAGAEAVSRHNVALMLFRAYKHQVFDWRNINYFSYVLNSRDLFVR